MSHLLQMRGLKLIRFLVRFISIASHLLQMRGLKRQPGNKTMPFVVASFTDAWIETVPPADVAGPIMVASFTDAWIETSYFV